MERVSSTCADLLGPLAFHSRYLYHGWFTVILAMGGLGWVRGCIPKALVFFLHVRPRGGSRKLDWLMCFFVYNGRGISGLGLSEWSSRSMSISSS
ncbi:hypothetical protein K469DRAFT_64944 [Zopfia rhizophila CBS 207.26]|uniref:Uncharacterized protein n=1 Tax=Zopfia rhizophila CBS 207.26 TaxID=1314779 RepID=A0A6A6DBI6_9PEZI|nr:hypothetical protein K469DRAFT_64944 [Zopfia rhizophila CBS 207.26]